jgi:hypothetical protein
VSLTATTVPLTAVQALLGRELPSRYTVTVDDAPTGTGVTLEVVSPPTPQVFTPLAGPDKASMLVQVTIRDATRTACRLAGDVVRQILTGTDRRGKPTTPLQVEGYTFDLPVTWGDGHAVTTNGVHTWVETYRITWQDRGTVTLPPES